MEGMLNGNCLTPSRHHHPHPHPHHIAISANRPLTVGVSQLHKVFHLRDVGADVRQQEMSLLLGLAKCRVGPRLATRDEHQLVPGQSRQVELLDALLVEQSAS